MSGLRMLLVARRASLLTSSIMLVAGSAFSKTTSPETGRWAPAFGGCLVSGMLSTPAALVQSSTVSERDVGNFDVMVATDVVR